jgi:hypothetical protein
MRLVRIPGDIYVDIDHIGMIQLKPADKGQVEVRIFLKDRTGLEPFYADRKQMLAFIEQYKIGECHAAPPYEGRPE